MLESLRAEQTKAALMEQYSFASIESSLCTGCYLIEKMVSNPVDFGFLFTSNVTKKVKSCMRAEMSLTTTALVSGLLGYVHPLSVSAPFLTALKTRPWYHHLPIFASGFLKKNKYRESQHLLSRRFC